MLGFLVKPVQLRPVLHLRPTVRLVPLRNYTQQATENAKNQNGSPFEILYFGRDEFSCTVLEELRAAKDVWKDISIVTQPDVKVGRRGSQLSISPLKVLGERLQLPVHTIPKERREFRHWQPPPPFDKSPLSPSRLLVTASFGRILSNSLIQRFQPGRRLNVHPSLLPAYRGPSPLQYTLIDGLKETGVCVIEMTEYKKGIDSGDIWGQRKLSVPKDVTFATLRDTLAREGGKTLVDVLRQMIAGTAVATPQQVVEGARRAPLITGQDGLLDFRSMTAQAVVQRHKGISHQKAVYARLKTGKTVQLHDPVVVENPTDSILSLIPESGLAIYEPRSKSVHIRCALGTVVAARKLQSQDKNALDAKSWWNGVMPEMRCEPSSNDGPIVFV